MHFTFTTKCKASIIYFHFCHSCRTFCFAFSLCNTVKSCPAGGNIDHANTVVNVKHKVCACWDSLEMSWLLYHNEMQSAVQSQLWGTPKRYFRIHQPAEWKSLFQQRNHHHSLLLNTRINTQGCLTGCFFWSASVCHALSSYLQYFKCIWPENQELKMSKSRQRADYVQQHINNSLYRTSDTCSSLQ